MQDRIVLLHAAIMPAPDDLAIAHQHRADGNPAFAQPLLRLFIGGIEEFAVEFGLTRHQTLR